MGKGKEDLGSGSLQWPQCRRHWGMLLCWSKVWGRLYRWRTGSDKFKAFFFLFLYLCRGRVVQLGSHCTAVTQKEPCTLCVQAEWHATCAFGHVTVSWAVIKGFCFVKTTFKSRRSSPVPAQQQDFVFLWHLANMAGELCSPEPSSLPPAAAFCVPCVPWSPRWQPVGQEAEIQGGWTIKPPFLSSSGSSCQLSSSSASHVCLSVGLSVSSRN